MWPACTACVTHRCQLTGHTAVCFQCIERRGSLSSAHTPSPASVAAQSAAGLCSHSFKTALWMDIWAGFSFPGSHISGKHACQSLFLPLMELLSHFFIRHVCLGAFCQVICDSSVCSHQQGKATVWRVTQACVSAVIVWMFNPCKSVRLLGESRIRWL